MPTQLAELENKSFPSTTSPAGKRFFKLDAISGKRSSSEFCLQVKIKSKMQCKDTLRPQKDFRHSPNHLKKKIVLTTLKVSYGILTLK